MFLNKNKTKQNKQNAPAAVVDAGGNCDLELFVLLHAPAARTRAAVLVDNLARPLALRAGALLLEHAQRRAHYLHDHALPVATAARAWPRAGFDPRALHMPRSHASVGNSP